MVFGGIHRVAGGETVCKTGGGQPLFRPGFAARPGLLAACPGGISHRSMRRWHQTRPRWHRSRHQSRRSRRPMAPDQAPMAPLQAPIAPDQAPIAPLQAPMAPDSANRTRPGANRTAPGANSARRSGCSHPSRWRNYRLNWHRNLEGGRCRWLVIIGVPS